MGKKLTAKQKRFIDEYLVDLNATQAAIRAGYSAKTAVEIGYENLRKPHIAAELEKRGKKLQKKTEITQEMVAEELRRIAFSLMSDYIEWGLNGVRLKDSSELTPEQIAAVAEISESVTLNGGTTRIKLYDKLSALEKLGKMLGMFVDRHEHQVEGGLTVEVLRDVIARAESGSDS